MIKVKVRIRYSYIPWLGKFEGKITFFLPTTDKRTILPILQSPHKFIEDILGSRWGYLLQTNMREETYSRYADTIEELEEKIKKDLKEKLSFLKKIVKENREKLKMVEGKEIEKTYLI